MSNSISTLLLRNLSDVFGEGDPLRRRAALEELWNEDGVFHDPNKGVYRGHDEIDRIAGALRAIHPDFQYQPVAEPSRNRTRSAVPTENSNALKKREQQAARRSYRW